MFLSLSRSRARHSLVGDNQHWDDTWSEWTSFSSDWIIECLGWRQCRSIRRFRRAQLSESCGWSVQRRSCIRSEYEHRCSSSVDLWYRSDALSHRVRGFYCISRDWRHERCFEQEQHRSKADRTDHWLTPEHRQWEYPNDNLCLWSPSSNEHISVSIESLCFKQREKENDQHPSMEEQVADLVSSTSKKSTTEIRIAGNDEAKYTQKGRIFRRGEINQTLPRSRSLGRMEYGTVIF